MFGLPADVKRLRSALDELNIDVIHLHRSADQILIGLAGRALRMKKVVRTWHRDPGQLAGPVLRRMTRATNAFCCVSRAHAETLIRAGALHAAFVAPGVDTELFKPADDMPRDRDECVIGLIGRWKRKEDRGQQAFLEVMRKLDPALKWRGVLLGRGENRDALASAIAAHPARARLSLLETAPSFPDQVAGLGLGLAFCTGADGGSRAVVEMLACGVPVCVADKEGLRELGDDPACGRVLPGADLNAWASEIQALLKNEELRKTMRAAARRRALETHALAKRGAALARLYGADPSGGDSREGVFRNP